MQKTIMVVDDEPDIIYSIKAGLEDIGAKYNIISVNSGKECLEMLNKSIPDLILLDIMMPGMNGWEVCSQIKSNEKTEKIPVIFLTAKIDDGSQSLGLKGADDYIAKPFDIADLKKRIDKLINSS